MVPWAHSSPQHKQHLHRLSKEAQVHLYFSGGASMPSWEGTLAPSGKYDWTECLQQQCSFMSNYFDHLLFVTACSWYRPR